VQTSRIAALEAKGVYGRNGLNISKFNAIYILLTQRLLGLDLAW
jgi:hypothetical protein